MANKRISELTSITGANVADADLLVVVDVSDTTMAASGTNKKITMAELAKDSALTDNLVAKSTLTTNGDMLTRAAGEPARITRADLAADTAFTSRYKPLASDVLFVGAADFAATFGSPTLGGTSSSNNGGTAVWLLDASSVEIVCAYVAIPPGWTTADVYLWWANDGIGSGDVVVAVWRNFISAGATIDSASGANQTLTATSRNLAIRSTVTTGLSVTANGILKLAVRRDAANGADTLANDMAVIGVELVRAS